MDAEQQYTEANFTALRAQVELKMAILGWIGRKNKITQRGALCGAWPSAPHDQRTKSAYIFGAICPEHGKAAKLVLPFCKTETSRCIWLKYLRQSRRVPMLSC